MRYGRRMPAEQVDAPRRAPPPIQPRYPAAQAQTVQIEIVARKTVDMAELAERQRAAREAARGEQAAAAPQRAPNASMQERALRMRSAPPEAAPLQPDRPTPAQVPRHAPADSQARTREVMRHRQAEPETANAIHSASGPPDLGTVLVIACCNHATILQQRLTQWRAEVPDLDVRQCVLDLGSTDDTAAIAEEVPTVRLLHRPGGLADPLRTLAATLRAVTADVVVFVDAAAEPGPAALRCAQAVRHGGALVFAAAENPHVCAISAKLWRQTPPAPQLALRHWVARYGGAQSLQLAAGRADPASLVQALWVAALRRRDRALLFLPARIRPMLGRVTARLLR